MLGKLWMSSNGLGLTPFGATIVEISCSEGRWCSVEKLYDVFS